jgi:ubiquinol-cytochrome c reductase cytochrome b/c1 subunit
VLSGILLAMHYSPEMSLAYDSVEKIMRDVSYG